MASTSETGHAKNVANFEDLISFCTGYGSSYNPSKSSIKVTALNTLFTNAKTALQTVKTAKTSFDNATNSREIIFEPLNKLTTRVINALDATDASEQTVKDAKTIARKIQGKRAVSINQNTTSSTEIPPAESTSTIQNISASQMSYDSRIDNFNKLITSLTSETLYAPNENDLKLTALNTLLTTFKTTNTAVVNSTTTYSNSLISRNTILYSDNTGLVDIAMEVKKYIKSVFGGTSSQYKQISKLQFKKLKN